MTSPLAPAAPTDLVPARNTPPKVAASPLGLAGRIEGNRYVLAPETPLEAWLNDGEVLQEMEKRVGFWIGDWLRAGEELYGERRYTQALKATGYAYQTLKNARRVAGRFPQEARVHDGLAFGHYDAVSSLPSEDAEELLAEAAEDKLSTRDLRERAKYRQRQLREATVATLPRPELRPGMARLLVGDARALPLRDATADLIVTSPPYALEKPYDGGDVAPKAWVDFMAEACAEAFRVTKPGGRLALNVPLDATVGGNRPTSAQATAAACAAGWTYRNTAVWHDDHLGKSTARGSYSAERGAGTATSPSIIAPVETIALFSKGDWWREEPPDRPGGIALEDWLAWTNGLWEFAGEQQPWEWHPAPFPLELPKRLVHLLSFPGDVVLDPFMGSGTTGVAALKAGRRFVGVDISEAYVGSAGRRLVALGLA
jgi:site-specific DNA-methyltransferase (adenine-specific)